MKKKINIFPDVNFPKLNTKKKPASCFVLCNAQLRALS